MASRYPPALMDAALALHDNRIPEAERALKAYLKHDPFDARAIRMLAELAGRIGRYRDAETLLRRAIELVPAFTAARANLATVLHRQNRASEALAILDEVMAEEPGNLGHANLRAAALGRVGGFDEAIALYEQVLARAADQPKVWMSYGHMLKTVGRQADGVAAYRRALAIEPTLGEVWWSLANLKTVRFDAADVTAMEEALTAPTLSEEGRFHLHFALGKAREDTREDAAAFDHYAQGNALRRRSLDYRAGDTTRFVDTSIAKFDAAFFARAQGGCPAPDPIFVLGMPRAGSTLVEQILASHSLVEGTSELPDIPALARTIPDYLEGLAALPPERMRELGEEYLRRASVQRRTDRPFFIDKLPNNWLHVPLIRAILPGAKIVDARRDARDCCWSNFKQHYARGQGFSYDLGDLGRYYRDYVRLVAYVDVVQPGAVHRVQHEALLAHPEREIRALLAHCGLAFEPACLSPHETERAVRTASSEQVRRPLSSAAVGGWRRFETWLLPLEQALGDLAA